MSKRKSLLSKHNLHWKDDHHILRAVSLLGQIGLVMSVAILIFTLLGLFLDRRLGLNGVCVAIGAIFGILSGGLMNFRLLSSFFDKEITDEINEKQP